MFKVMNSPEPFLWGGVILSILGLAGTGVSAYFVATKSKNEKDSAGKIIGLVFSIVLALIGIALLVYYYKGNLMGGGGGECPLEQMAAEYPQVLPDVAPPPLPMPVPAPVSSQAPVNFNINVNQPSAQKVV